jgi:hypothetical protein
MTPPVCSLSREVRGPIPLSRHDVVRYEVELQVVGAEAAVGGGDGDGPRTHRVRIGLAGPLFRASSWQKADDDERARQLAAYARRTLARQRLPDETVVDLQINADTEDGAFAGHLPPLSAEVDPWQPFQMRA